LFSIYIYIDHHAIILCDDEITNLQYDVRSGCMHACSIVGSGGS